MNDLGGLGFAILIVWLLLALWFVWVAAVATSLWFLLAAPILVGATLMVVDLWRE